MADPPEGENICWKVSIISLPSLNIGLNDCNIFISVFCVSISCFVSWVIAEIWSGFSDFNAFKTLVPESMWNPPFSSVGICPSLNKPLLESAKPSAHAPAPAAPPPIKSAG